MATADGDGGHRRQRQRPPTMATARTKKGLRFCVELAVAEVARVAAARDGEE